MKNKIFIALSGVAIAAAAWIMAQPRPLPPSIDRRGVPSWQVDNEMPRDVFTFCRLRYSSYSGRGRKWATDYPDADLNFSYRLQELTSMKVHPDGMVLDITCLLYTSPSPRDRG